MVDDWLDDWLDDSSLTLTSTLAQRVLTSASTIVGYCSGYFFLRGRLRSLLMRSLELKITENSEVLGVVASLDAFLSSFSTSRRCSQSSPGCFPMCQSSQMEKSVSVYSDRNCRDHL